jgi:signal transduction histidine kinase
LESHETRVSDTSERLALVVHEFRAPLTVVRGYLQLLEQPLDENELSQARGAAGRAVERLELLLDDLMAAISNPEVFAPAVNSHVSLRELAHEVVEEISPLHPNEIAVRGGWGEVQGDRVRLRQAIENLVSNAIKHTPGDGRVEIEVADANSDNTVLFAVQDEGPGIRHEDRERVFNLFERLEAGANAPQGLGLGLPITRAIVAGHGGRVFIDDSATGARFVMELPSAPSEN